MTAMNIAIRKHAAFVLTDTSFRPDNVRDEVAFINKVTALPCMPGLVVGRGAAVVVFAVALLIQQRTDDYDIAAKNLQAWAREYEKTGISGDFEIALVGWSKTFQSMAGRIVRRKGSGTDAYSTSMLGRGIVAPSNYYLEGPAVDAFLAADTAEDAKVHGLRLLSEQARMRTENGFIVHGRAVMSVVTRDGGILQQDLARSRSRRDGRGEPS